MAMSSSRRPSDAHQRMSPHSKASDIPGSPMMTFHYANPKVASDEAKAAVPRRTRVYRELGAAASSSAVPLRTINEPSPPYRASCAESVESSRSCALPHRPPVLERDSTVAPSSGDKRNPPEINARQYGAIRFGILVAFLLPFYDVIIHHFAPDVDHWCARPSFIKDKTTDKWKEYHLPKDETGNYSKCEIYKGDTSKEKVKVPCNEWEYSPEYGMTIVREWDLVCNRTWLVPVASSMFFIGSVCFLPLTGHVADWHGRRTVIRWATVSMQIISIAILFSHSFYLFLVLRFFLGAVASTLFVTTIVLLIETLSPNQRSTYGVAVHLGYAAGNLLVAVLALFRLSWRIIQFVAVGYTSLLLLCCIGVMESPEWQVASTQEPTLDNPQLKIWGYVVLNTVRPSGASIHMIQENGRKVASLILCWVAMSLTYQTGVEVVIQSEFIYLLLALLRVPADCVAVLIAARYDRHWGLTCGFLVVAFSCIVACLCVQEVVLFNIAAVSLNFSCVVAVALLWLSTSEYYPTVIRCTGVATCSAIGQLFSLGAPAFLRLGKLTDDRLPLLIVAVLCLSGGVLAYNFPETKHGPLVGTVHDLSELIANPIKSKARESIQEDSTCATTWKKGDSWLTWLLSGK
ncbi:solute carrier family 22 member 13-like [Ornithodoros turicata]|uniref:solute carrier family 22 member 13-like n=1 Tax=Ornithodoros turicata TaxID=34597 RepID=UPI003139016F